MPFVKGERIYKTGDLARWPAPVRGDPLDFLGLDIADHQPGLLRGERRDDGFANALRATGNDADAACVAKVDGRPEGWGRACRIHGRGW